MTDTSEKPEPAQIALRSEVLSAVSSAIGKVQKVAKDGKNKHDNYNFASIDDFLALVNPICAETGLIVSMQEKSIEDFMRKGKFGDNAWIRMTWEITVYHTSGQSLPSVMRTVEVLRNGAQAYGSAQSYALKQFLRSLFLIPTGDKDDADFERTDAGVVTRHTSQPNTISADQFIALRDTAEEAGVPAEKICAAYGAPSLEQFPVDAFDRAMKKLRATIAAAQEQQAEPKASPAAQIDDVIPY